MGAYTCPECALTNGWHDDPNADPDDTTAPMIRCPNRAMTEQLEHARELTAASREKASEAAKQIIRDVARSRLELSGNDTRDLMAHNDVPEQVIGPAFHALSLGDNPVLEATGRYVMSTDPATRHRLVLWRSRIYRGSAA